MKLVLFGTGQLSEVISYYIQHDTNDTIEAYTVDSAYVTCEKFQDRSVIPWQDLKSYADRFSDIRLLCPISYKNLNEHRKTKYLEARSWGIKFYSFIHSSSYVYSKNLGDNLIILENCRIQPFSEIGNNCILWSNTHIGHHTTVADHCFFAGTGGIAGSSSIGECCFVGGTATIGDNVRIGDHCIIGAGASVTSDVESFSAAMTPKTRILKNASLKLAKYL